MCLGSYLRLCLFVRHTGANADGDPLPVCARLAHAAVALNEDLYIFGGERESNLLQELCVVNTADQQVGSCGSHGPILCSALFR